MKKPECGEHERNADRYLNRVGQQYLYDSASGLYRQNSAAAQDDRQKQTGIDDLRRPIVVDVRRDWLVILISVFTLIGLGLTVHYAHKQWQEARSSARAAACALKEAQAQTRIQRQEVEGNLAADLIVDSPRPSPFAVDESSLKNQGLYIYVANAGKVTATNIRLKGSLTRLQLPSFNVIGRPEHKRASKDRLASEELAHPTQGFATEDFHLRLDTDELSLADIESIKKEQEAIRVDGTVAYDNGFSRRIDRSFCFIFARIPTFDDQGKDVNGTIGTWGLCDDMRGYIKHTYRQH